MTPRDVFWTVIEERMNNDSRYIILTGDMGAPALDNIRRRFPHRFRNCGCSEQAMVDIAVGWALEGYWPIIFGITPFVTSRCYEQIKMAAIMGVSVAIVGVGAGLGYADAGPTHHGADDYNIMRIIPGMTVYTPSSTSMVKYCARQVGKGLVYIRLDREELPEIHYNPITLDSIPDIDELFKEGIWVHRKGKRYIISHGYMVHRALKVAEKFGWGVVEIFRHPWDDTVLFGDDFCVLEENYSAGGLWSAVLEKINQTEKDCITSWGTREELHKRLKMGEGDIEVWLQESD